MEQAKELGRWLTSRAREAERGQRVARAGLMNPAPN
jgi:hypothetical protein